MSQKVKFVLRWNGTQRCRPVAVEAGVRGWAPHQRYLETQCLPPSIKSRLCQHYSPGTERGGVWGGAKSYMSHANGTLSKSNTFHREMWTKSLQKTNHTSSAGLNRSNQFNLISIIELYEREHCWQIMKKRKSAHSDCYKKKTTQCP